MNHTAPLWHYLVLLAILIASVIGLIAHFVPRLKRRIQHAMLEMLRRARMPGVSRTSAVSEHDATNSGSRCGGCSGCSSSPPPVEKISLRLDLHHNRTFIPIRREN